MKYWGEFLSKTSLLIREIACKYDGVIIMQLIALEKSFAK